MGSRQETSGMTNINVVFKKMAYYVLAVKNSHKKGAKSAFLNRTN
jgi:hypothetical protein